MRAVKTTIRAHRPACLAAACIAIAAASASIAPSALAGTGTLSLLAGNGSTEFATAPGPATSTGFEDAEGIAVDHAGDVYFASSDDNRVFKVTPAGELTVVAGTGTEGAASAGLATESDLSFPDGVALDASGNLYIADEDNNEIEKVTPQGILSIVAGNGTEGAPTPGRATESKLVSPSQVAVDAAGDIYFPDFSGNQVLKVDPSGILSIVAGTGSAGVPTAGPAKNSKLDGPDAVAVDSSGNLYIADQDNNVVEKVTPAGELSVFAGNGTKGLSTPGAATSVDLAYPEGIAIDESGNVYITDNASSQVVEVSGGQLSVIAGNGTEGPATYGGPATESPLGYPFGIAITPAGGLVFGDDSNDVVDLIGALITAPAATSAPSISGTPAVGQTLTATPGTWTEYPTSYSYQWELCDSSGANCTDISGATASSYTVLAADAGHTLRVVVTAGNDVGSTPDSSAATAAVPLSAVAPVTGVSSSGFAFRGSTHGAGGTVTVTIAVPGAGSVQVLGTHENAFGALTASNALEPGPHRFDWGRATSTTVKSSTIKLVIHPDGTGKRLLVRHRHHGWALNVRVWATYTPAGGTPVTIHTSVRVLAARRR
jgi:sugar lactone lactonase YvrE